jgi:serine/threonine-protein kinase
MPTGEFEVAKVTRVLADRYRIERVIGEGGMATVYLAEDLKHHRKVAVKVMRPELAATLGTDRFLREVEIAAQLNHPNILPMYDSGEVEGILYYVMPYVEGESLASRLSSEGELPVPVALRIGREVAEALAYAHKRGIIHRDIKPANILLHEGHALVADFGIARALDAEGEAITKTGLAIGTPQYMSPEQSTGDKSVDARTDIYALGAVIYEMLTGEPPFTGRTPQAVVARSLTERPRPLTATREGLPAGLEDVVSKSLSRSAADRFPTATALADSLATVESGSTASHATIPARPVRPARPARLVMGIAVVAILAIAAFFFLRRPSSSVARGPGVARVAVLPFQNQGDTANNYIVDGITDEVRGRLSKVNGLAVIASASSSQFRGSSTAPAEIARELRAQYLLMGRVRWAEGPGSRRMQVVTELVDSTGATAWQQSFDADLTDVFAVQGQVATRVAGALGAQLGSRETQDLTKRPTDNPAAWDAYLKARALNGTDPAALRAAIAGYEQAVALDSSFAAAWVGLGQTATVLYNAGAHEAAVSQRAKEAIDRAIRLAPDDGTGYAAAATYYANVPHDPEKSAENLEIALRLAPNDPVVLRSASNADLASGNINRAVERLERARDLDPRSEVTIGSLSRAYLFAHRLPEAVDAAEAAISLEPDDPGNYSQLSKIRIAAGDLEGARAAGRRATARISPPVVAAYYAGYEELSFGLDSSTAALIGRLTPSAFDGDRAWWGQSLASYYWSKGRKDLARVYGDSALAPSLAQARQAPNDPSLLTLYAVALAYAGHTDSAVATGRRSVAMYRTEASASLAYDQLQLARIYIVAGRYGDAMDQLEVIMTQPYQLTTGWLRVDPLFDPLRGTPRFQALLK